MEYTIHLDKMEFRAFHGCYELERKVGNRFTVNLDIRTELGGLAESDDVTQAVNYLTVYEMVREQMKITNCTIEAVACRIISTIRAAYPEVIGVRCEVAKIAPPLGGKVASVSVVIDG